MKTPHEFVIEFFGREWSTSNERAIAARDAEHAAVIAALQRTVETLGADVLRLAGQLERAAALLTRVPKYVREDRAVTHGSTRLARLCLSIDAFLAPAVGPTEAPNTLTAPPQPEPVKAHAYTSCLNHVGCGVCGKPDGPPWHAPSGCGR